jgi:hypothetical protein
MRECILSDGRKRACLSSRISRAPCCRLDSCDSAARRGVTQTVQFAPRALKPPRDCNHRGRCPPAGAASWPRSYQLPYCPLFRNPKRFRCPDRGTMAVRKHHDHDQTTTPKQPQPTHFTPTSHPLQLLVVAVGPLRRPPRPSNPVMQSPIRYGEREGRVCDCPWAGRTVAGSTPKTWLYSCSCPGTRGSQKVRPTRPRAQGKPPPKTDLR